MRKATLEDKEYVADCFIKITLFIKSRAQSSDIYARGLPDVVDENLLKLAASYITDEEAITLIEERDNQRVACIAGRVEDTSFPASRIGRVGNIAICWVSSAYRGQNIATELVTEVECWFKNQGITVVELSYLAENTLAEKAWRNIGYTPFRVFSYKNL